MSVPEHHNRWRLRGAVFLCVVFSCWVVRGAAQAQIETASFEHTVEAGMAAYSSGNFREAHALFTRAHAERPSARTLRVLGITEFALDDYNAAHEHLSAALADGRQPLEPSQRTEVDELLQWMLRNLIALQLDYAPAQAQARLDAKPVHAGQLLLSAGDHELQLSMPGYRSKERPFVLTKGQAPMQLSLSLDALPKAPPAETERSNAWLWVGAGSAVALVGGSVLFGIGRMNVDRAEDADMPAQPEEVTQQESRGVWFTAVGGGLAVVGLAGVTVSLIMLLRSDAPEARARRSSLTIGPTDIRLERVF